MNEQKFLEVVQSLGGFKIVKDEIKLHEKKWGHQPKKGDDEFLKDRLQHAEKHLAEAKQAFEEGRFEDAKSKITDLAAVIFTAMLRIGK